jgi:hypothetical protein
VKTITLLLLAAIAVLTGCAQLTSTQTETIAEDGASTRTTRLQVTTFFDARSDLQKLRSSTTDKTQGLTVGGLSEGSSGTNTVEALKQLKEILGLIAK